MDAIAVMACLRLSGFLSSRPCLRTSQAVLSGWASNNAAGSNNAIASLVRMVTRIYRTASCTLKLDTMLKFTFSIFAIAGSLLAQVQQFEAKLPAPFATPSSDNRTRVVARPDGAQLQVPHGFEIEEYATGFNTPRFMYTAPGGEIILSDSSAGAVYVLVDKNKSYKNPERKKILEGLTRPYGLAIWKDYLYVGEQTSVKRYKYDAKNMTAGAGEEIASYKDFTAGHWTRSLLFDRHGEKLYWGVGSGPKVNRHEEPRTDLVKKTIPGDILLQSHVAVLDFMFYTGKQFPAEYQGGAFLALHGSWNRSKRVGYSVAFVPFKDGKPSGPVRDFMTGWMIAPESPQVWGRPVALMQLPDGSILVSDDGGKKIWRIFYKG